MLSGTQRNFLMSSWLLVVPLELLPRKQDLVQACWGEVDLRSLWRELGTLFLSSLSFWESKYFLLSHSSSFLSLPSFLLLLLLHVL